MSTARLLGLAALTLLPPAAGDLPWPVAALCLAGLPILGELWLRALVGTAPPAAARLGLAMAAGLVSLPLVGIVLHVVRVPIGPRPLVAGLAALTAVLGTVALLRGTGPVGQPGRPSPRPRPGPAGTGVAVAVPAALVLAVGGAAVLAYDRLPHPPQPGYTSVALAGWAARIDRPVAIPARGLTVPLRVSSAGRPAVTAALRVRVGDRPATGRPLAIAADSTRAIAVHVPAPPDGCLHRIEISVGTASTVFYGRGPSRC